MVLPIVENESFDVSNPHEGWSCAAFLGLGLRVGCLESL